MHACTHTCVHACMYACMHVHACMHACMHAYMHVYMHVCMHGCSVCVYVCVCMHIEASRLVLVRASEAAHVLWAELPRLCREPRPRRALRDSLGRAFEARGTVAEALSRALALARFDMRRGVNFRAQTHGAIREPARLHAYMHAYMHACIHAYMHTRMHACMHTCIQAYMLTCLHAYIHAHMNVVMHTCISANIRSRPGPEPAPGRLGCRVLIQRLVEQSQQKRF